MNAIELAQSHAARLLDLDNSDTATGLDKQEQVDAMAAWSLLSIAESTRDIANEMSRANARRRES